MKNAPRETEVHQPDSMTGVADALPGLAADEVDGVIDDILHTALHRRAIPSNVILAAVLNRMFGGNFLKFAEAAGEAVDPVCANCGATLTRGHILDALELWGRRLLDPNPATN